MPGWQSAKKDFECNVGEMTCEPLEEWKHSGTML